MAFPSAAVVRYTTALAALASALAVAQSATPAPSGAAPGRLAVIGDGTLYVIRPGDGRKRMVAPLDVSSAAWSRDGRRLAYVGEGAVRTASRPRHVIAPLGGMFTEGVSWAPSGRRLAFAAHAAFAPTARLVVARRDGRRPRVVERGASPYQVPQWSPTGNEIAYFKPSADAQAAIWLVRPTGGGHRLVQRGVVDDGTSLAWSPDGTQLAFVRRLTEAGGSEVGLAVMRANGTKTRAVAAAAAGNEAGIVEVRWSPSGKAIAYLFDPDGPAPETELRLAFPSGAPGRVLVRAPYIDELAWSPDGRWLAYIAEDPSTASGVPMSVWLVRSDGSESRMIARFDEPAYGLAWGR